MIYILIAFFFFFSCGIKADTQALLLPEIEVKRIGNGVYVINLADQISIENFQNRGSFFYREDPRAFCFEVKRINGRVKKQCVDGALKQTPQLSIIDTGEKVFIRASGFDNFALYPYVNGDVHILERKLIEKEYEITKDYSKKCYALTGVAGSIESLPVTFCIDAKPAPYIEDVTSLEYRVLGDRLFLIWSYHKDYESFVVYQDDKVVGETKGFLFEVQKPSSSVSLTVKVRTKEGFLSDGRSITYSP